MLIRHSSIRVNVLRNDIIYSILQKTRRAERIIHYALDDGLIIHFDRSDNSGQKYIQQSLKVESKSFRFKSKADNVHRKCLSVSIVIIVGVVMIVFVFPTYRLFFPVQQTTRERFLLHAFDASQEFLLTPESRWRNKQKKKIPSAFVMEMEGIPTVQLTEWHPLKNIKVEPMSTDWRWAGSLNSHQQHHWPT